MPSFVLKDFGCRANQADGAALARALEASGWRPATVEEEADWAVLNTCTVTATADAEARRAIRRLRRRHPEMRIAVTGCYSQRAPEEVRRIEGVSVVANHKQKTDLPALLRADGSGSPKLSTAAAFERAQAATAPVSAGRTRPTIKVQEGCSRRCSYCVIPLVRGPHRSRPLGELLGEVQATAAAGVQELVLSGINLGEWGRDLDGRLGLTDLVAAILEQTRLPRLRLSSVEPVDWDEALSAMMAASENTAPRLARHAHLPLQSGCDTVLQRMRRRYRVAEYAARIERLRALAPEAAIGADVMSGFPGETEAEFEATRAFVAAMPFTYLHVFTFSARAGTEAARRLAAREWPPVDAAVAARRADILRRLGAQKYKAFLNSMPGRRLSVVSLNGDGATAISDNYLPVKLATPTAPNTMLTVEVTGVENDSLLAVACA